MTEYQLPHIRPGDGYERFSLMGRKAMKDYVSPIAYLRALDQLIPTTNATAMPPGNCPNNPTGGDHVYQAQYCVHCGHKKD